MPSRDEVAAQPEASGAAALRPTAILGYHLTADPQDGVLTHEGSHAADRLSDLGLEHVGGACQRLWVQCKLVSRDEAIRRDFNE